MSTLHEKIQVLNAKANDTSLSNNEREVSRKMAEKLHKKLMAQGGDYQKKLKDVFSNDDRYPNDAPADKIWVVPILKYAFDHPEYNEKIAIPLRSWGCDVRVNKNTDNVVWIVHNRELSEKANRIMRALATEGANLEDMKQHHSVKNNFTIKDGELRTILLIGIVFVFLMMLFF